MELFMKNRDFDKWLSTMNDSIATWKYYTDFEKVYKNAEKIKTEIYILNSLINSKNIREDFKETLSVLVQTVSLFLNIVSFVVHIRNVTIRVLYLMRLANAFGPTVTSA